MVKPIASILLNVLFAGSISAQMSLANMALIPGAIVQKRVRLRTKNAAGGEEEQVEIFAWLSTYQKIGGQWKLTTVASTNTPEEDK